MRWLPLQANRDFQSAMAALHGSVTALIRERLAERRQDNNSSASASSVQQQQDLFTFMVDEILQGEAGVAEALAEEVLLGDVSFFTYTCTYIPIPLFRASIIPNQLTNQPTGLT